MKFSTRARYGLQIMLELAYHYSRNPIYLKDIAARQDISLKYLEQLIIPLRVAGLVKNIRGTGGGYTLTRPPAEINALEIVSTLEGPLNIVSCIEDESACQKTDQCPLREVWEGLKDTLENVLQKETLQDLYQKQLQYDKKDPRPIKRKSKK